MRNDLFARHPLRAAGAGSLLLWTAFFLGLGPRFATNDDPLIAMLAAGAGFASVPDEHLVFTNVLIGLALKRLYGAVPGLPWYALYLLATHVVAQTALLYAALRTSPRWLRAALSLVYFAVAAVPFANNLQFTVTAFVAAQAGLLLALDRLERPGGRGLAILATSLAVLGALIRFEAFALALVLALPVAAVRGWGRDRRALLSAAVPLAFTVGLALGAQGFDAAYYQRQADWAAYREYNRALRSFVDFDRAADYTPETARAFRAVGWSRNDHRLLLHWFHADAEVFSTANLHQVLAQTPEAPFRPTERVIRGLGRMATNRPALPVLLALPLAAVAVWPNRRSRAAVLAALGSSAVVLVSLLVFRKAPPHVYLPVLAWPIAVSLVLEGASFASRAGRVAVGVAAVLAAAATVRVLAFQRMESAEGDAREEEYARALEPLRTSPERLYLLWSTFPYHVAPPLAPPGAWPGLRFLALGWPQRTPAAERSLAAHGHPNLIQALGDPHVRLIAPPDAAIWVEQYARRHHGRALGLVQEGSVPGFAVFRAGAAPPGAADRVPAPAPVGPQ